MIPRAWRKLRNKRPLVINLVSSFHVGQSTRCTCHLLSSSRARVFFMYKRKSEGRCAAKQQNNAKKERSMRSLEHTGTSSSCRLELPRAARLSLSLSLSLWTRIIWSDCARMHRGNPKPSLRVACSRPRSHSNGGEVCGSEVIELCIPSPLSCESCFRISRYYICRENFNEIRMALHLGAKCTYYIRMYSRVANWLTNSCLICVCIPVQYLLL